MQILCFFNLNIKNKNIHITLRFVILFYKKVPNIKFQYFIKRIYITFRKHQHFLGNDARQGDALLEFISVVMKSHNKESALFHSHG